MAEAVREKRGLEERLANYFDREYSRMGEEKVSSFLIRELGTLNKQTLQGGSALDIGCGLGSNTLFIARTEIFSSVDGIDLSKVGIKKSREAVAEEDKVKPNFILGDFTSAKLDGNYSFILVSNVLEYVSEDKKKAFIDKVMESTRPGGINMICFASSLPKNFMERLIEHRYTIDSKLPISLFPGSEQEKAVALNFESGLLNKYKEAGWSVISARRHEGERNFVSVQVEAIIVQKPLDGELPPKRS